MGDISTVFLYRRWANVTPNSGVNARISSAITAATAAIELYCCRTFGTATYRQWLDGRGVPQLILPQYPITLLNGCAINGLEVLTVENSNKQFATVQTNETGVTLISYNTSGDATTSTLAYATYKTVQTVADAINALSAAGWSATVASGYGSYPSVTIKPFTSGPANDLQYVDLYIPDQWQNCRVSSECDSMIERLYGTPFPCGKSNVFVWYTAGYTLPVDAAGNASLSVAGNVPVDLTDICNMIAKAVYESGEQSFGVVQSESIGNYSYSVSEGGRGVIADALKSHAKSLSPYRRLT